MSPILKRLCIIFEVGMINRNEEYNRVIARNLRLIRDVQGMSQYVLSLRSGIAKSQIGKIESGNANPTISTLIDLAIALDTSINDLIPPEFYLKSRRDK